MDVIDFGRYFAVLLFVLGLLGLIAFMARRAGLAHFLPAIPRAGAPRRLEVSSTLMLDARRRVVLVRVDDEEHVLLLGLAGETVLDRRPAPPRFEPVEPETAGDSPPEGQS
ncbi:MAG: flagellar biosynthetic protein FliO [Caulobacterales bacterium]|uniref:flagellar biosynthetic protein FliO n=1 Tax=Glycocaulis sp. TaxID=1969725 RepID=UPI003F9FC42D